jgi:hypothetical protein
MRVAYIVLAHRLPDQLVRLVHRLDGEHAIFLVHVDKRAPRDAFAAAIRELERHPRVRLLERRRCERSGFGTVAVPLEAFRELLDERLPFDHAFRLSGQDYPIKSNREILEFLERNKERSFLQAMPVGQRSPSGWSERDWYEWKLRYRRWHYRRSGVRLVLPLARRVPRGLEPWGGEACWCLTSDCVRYAHEFARRERGFVRFFEHVDKPDEMFFQTILMNSPHERHVIREDVHYTDWSEGRSHPSTFTVADFERLRLADDLFARKFDVGVNADILDLIDERLLRS